ncbi:hypothetical protein G7Y89_g15436 [Cudoniella acicularis]|uniref:Aminotransferase class I/classII large domain-containing protein n=1 Tax=Cudoniella acicularis TaxID=354080 RepID=A0A8H4QQ09_9HELO|nr:hypothetical protein G7Y89_g15436 [Cudoniella acicularis]
MGSIQAPSSGFESAQYIPLDHIFEVTKKYFTDPDQNKVNVGQGTYRDENGKPWIFTIFSDGKVELVFKGTEAFKQNRSLSGTGALLAGLALKKANTGIKKVLITDPTWPNHGLLFTSMGLEVVKLPYYKSGAFDSERYMTALGAAESGSAIILHSCAYNPTGCDPTRDQWKGVATVIRAKKIFPIFDSAYLGFNSGRTNRPSHLRNQFSERN